MPIAVCRSRPDCMGYVRASGYATITSGIDAAEAELTEVIIRLNPLEDGDAKLLPHARKLHH